MARVFACGVILDRNRLGLTGAIESQATTLPGIIGELMASRLSERQGRVIDRDQAGSMERKKQEGYF